MLNKVEVSNGDGENDKAMEESEMLVMARKPRIFSFSPITEKPNNNFFKIYRSKGKFTNASYSGKASRKFEKMNTAKPSMPFLSMRKNFFPEWSLLMDV